MSKWNLCQCLSGVVAWKDMLISLFCLFFCGICILVCEAQWLRISYFWSFVAPDQAFLKACAPDQSCLMLCLVLHLGSLPPPKPRKNRFRNGFCCKSLCVLLCSLDRWSGPRISLFWGPMAADQLVLGPSGSWSTISGAQWPQIETQCPAISEAQWLPSGSGSVPSGSWSIISGAQWLPSGTGSAIAEAQWLQKPSPRKSEYFRLLG